MDTSQTDTLEAQNIDTTTNISADTSTDTDTNTKTDKSTDKNPEEPQAASCPFNFRKNERLKKASDTITNSPLVQGVFEGVTQGVRKNVESVLQYTLSKVVRPTANAISYRIINGLKPVKMYAYKTRFPLVKRTILEVTTPIDFAMIWLNIQNETMELHEKAYGGNFLFGKSVMVTDYSKTASEIIQPSFRSNDFMGVNIVSSASDVFATNTGILNQNPPIRESTRQYMDDHIFTRCSR